MAFIPSSLRQLHAKQSEPNGTRQRRANYSRQLLLASTNVLQRKNSQNGGQCRCGVEAKIRLPSSLSFISKKISIITTLINRMNAKSHASLLLPERSFVTRNIYFNPNMSKPRLPAVLRRCDTSNGLDGPNFLLTDFWHL